MSDEHWTARHGKPIIFVILTLVAVGVYLATTIPIAVFPEVEFPRIIVGVDNGVAPIDQMQVTGVEPGERVIKEGGVGLEDKAQVRIMKPGEKAAGEKDEKDQDDDKDTKEPKGVKQ